MESAPSVRVLVVDDDHPITDTLVLILRSAGFKAIGACSAAAARDEFVLFKPDLVLTDVVLGDGNGVQLAVEFRRGRPECRILLFSGQVTTHDLKRMAPEGRSFRLLPKPLHPSQLVHVISTLFEQSDIANA